jgi:hypothetical protein
MPLNYFFHLREVFWGGLMISRGANKNIRRDAGEKGCIYVKGWLE